MTKNSMPEIPMDIHDSSHELVILLPLGWVAKESIKLELEKTTLHISGERKAPLLNEHFVVLQDQCFWGEFKKTIDLPTSVYFDKIQSKFLDTNILLIIIPKVIIPEKLSLPIEFL